MRLRWKSHKCIQHEYLPHDSHFAQWLDQLQRVLQGGLHLLDLVNEALPKCSISEHALCQAERVLLQARVGHALLHVGVHAPLSQLHVLPAFS